MALGTRIQNDIVKILNYGQDVEVIMPLQRAIAQRLRVRQDDEQDTSPGSGQEPSAPEPSSTEEAVDSVVPSEEAVTTEELVTTEEAVTTEAMSDIAAEPPEAQTNETGGGEEELQQGTLSDPVEAQTGEATPVLSDSLMDVFLTETADDYEQHLPAGLVEIGIHDLLEDCQVVLQRLKGGLTVG